MKNSSAIAIFRLLLNAENRRPLQAGFREAVGVGRIVLKYTDQFFLSAFWRSTCYATADNSFCRPVNNVRQHDASAITANRFNRPAQDEAQRAVNINFH